MSLRVLTNTRILAFLAIESMFRKQDVGTIRAQVPQAHK